MVRIVALLVGVVGITVALVLGTRSTQPEADLRFMTRGATQTLDPAQMSYMQDIQLAGALWEGLTSPHPQTCVPVPGVAILPPEKSEDGRRYLFTLRPDARWSNGDPVTATDFVRGWRRAIEPGTADVYAELISSRIAGAQQYADWRNQCVDCLGVVRLLQSGSPVRGEAMAKAIRGQAAGELRKLIQTPLPDPLPSDQDDLWNTVSTELGSQRVDWKELGDRILDEHVAELDTRFSRVGLTAVDTHHLEVKLEQPLPFLLDLTGFATFSPIHASVELLRESYEGRPLSDTGVLYYDPQWTKPEPQRNGYPGLITNGAYKLTAWKFRQFLRFEANPFYWNRAAVRSATVEAMEIEYQNAGFLLYQQGAVDFMIDLTMDYTPELVRQKQSGLRDDVHAIPCFGTFYLSFNCREKLNDGRPNPFSDVRLRKAFSYATNKQEIVDHVYRLGNPVSGTYVPAGQLPGYRSPRGLGYDLKVAHRYLAEAGYPEGRGLPVIEYLYNRELLQEQMAQALKRMWERDLGIKVELQGKETKAFSEDRSEHRFMLSRGTWFGDYMDPTTFLDLCQSENGHNSAGFKDAHYDELLKAASREPDAAKRYEILSQAEAYLVEEQLPILPIGTSVVVCAWRPEVTGIYANPRVTFPMQHIAVKR